MIDVTGQISAVERRLGSRTLPAGQARVLTISQTYDAPVADVWDACTSAERIPRWFLPVSGELKLGGRYQLEGNAGGTVERCDPPHSFAATWELGGEVSWIEVRLTDAGAGRTRFELEHVAHVDDQRWAEYGPGAVGIGWDLALVGLASHFATDGTGIDPASGAAWVGSAEGRRFMTESSARWTEASVAAGTPADQARAAGDRVTAFYTGAPTP
ncbi:MULTISPECIES: SRPBCC family protein [Micromonospora]|uniref:SRPBCC family protein n=1 Tax=Micromonospora solifontis TaxID=2487138 RepID=A0ABX9WD34_9ACTN|nr:MULTISPECIES: SRPBCC family protein [Micromonospora]NES16184.1 SRPBCC family protein [Micromonospora sp. PPF5-17B]NES38015.1 SRPBCC family protein [Micromonospora solifontis]NES57671.1 SRPBCC family protein [Micromonospora sp. PPF5-6]RNL97694.1 SRPBCC family protein [Micromonospora solifontis]